MEGVLEHNQEHRVAGANRGCKHLDSHWLVKKKEVWAGI